MIRSEQGEKIKEIARAEFIDLLGSDEDFNNEWGNTKQAGSDELGYYEKDFDEWYQGVFLPCIICEEFGIMASINKGQ